MMPVTENDTTFCGLFLFIVITHQHHQLREHKAETQQLTTTLGGGICELTSARVDYRPQLD